MRNKFAAKLHIHVFLFNYQLREIFEKNISGMNRSKLSISLDVNGEK